MEDYNEFLDLEDPEDRTTYDRRYITKLKELTEGVDSEDRDAVIDELKTIKYDPTSNPEQDCELNYLRGQNQRKRKLHQFSKSEESFLRYQAEEDGISLSQAKRNARKFLKGGK
jgi:hypothetical protein